MLLKTGKLIKTTTKVLEKRNICILALQETRFLDKNPIESDGFRTYEGKPVIKNNSNIVNLVRAFMVKRNINESIINFTSLTESISLMSLRSANKAFSIINMHVSIHEDDRRNPEKMEAFWETFEDKTSEIPHQIKVLVSNFTAQIGKKSNIEQSWGLPSIQKNKQN